MVLLKRTTLVEKIIFLAALGVFVGSVVLLVIFNKLFSKPFVSPEDVIAKVTSVSNEGKRRTPTMFEFSDLAADDPIGNGDTVFSGPQSQVAIKFTKGTVLNVGADSLVVIRMIDGKLEIKVDKGSVKGKLAKGTEMELQSEEESVSMNGKEDTEFDVNYLPKVGFEPKKKRLDMDLATATHGDLADTKRKSREDKDVAQGEGLDPVPSDSKPRIRAVNPGDFKVVESIKMMPKKYILKTPYPRNNAVVLHKEEYQLPVFPKTKCETNCHLDIYLDDQKYFSRDFGPHIVPIVYIKVVKAAEARVRWSLRDGDAEAHGQFDLLPFSDENVANALKQKQSIEVVD